MAVSNEASVGELAKSVYTQKLQSQLETEHWGEFVAIEPESGDYFLGKTLSDAIASSRAKYPDRLAHAIRIGHKAAICFGMQIQ